MVDWYQETQKLQEGRNGTEVPVLVNLRLTVERVTCKCMSVKLDPRDS